MKVIKTETIDTTEQIKNLVDWLVLRHAPPVPRAPTMYVDLEGVNLGREGSLSILTLLIDTGIPTRRVCLIDVYTLGTKAFETAGSKRTTLKDILQDENIPKVFFDVRSDSDALFAHFNVALQGVEDVQLMESATRKTTHSRRLLNSLKTCVENNVFTSIDRSGQTSWNLAKEKGGRLFKAENGGSYEIFNQRPIPEDLIAYCAGDVQYLPELRNRFWTEQTFRWRELVGEELRKRVMISQSPEYQPHGPHKSLSPWSQEHNTLLNEWSHGVSPRLSDDHWDWGNDATSWRDCIDDCDIGYYSN